MTKKNGSPLKIEKTKTEKDTFNPKNARWESGTVEYEGNRYMYMAKVYNVGSDYGINEGPVSKLEIIRTLTDWYAGDCVYNWDREADVDRAPEGLVDAIIELVS